MKKKLLYSIDILLFILLFFINNIYVLFIFRIVFINDIVATFIMSLTSKEKRYLMGSFRIRNKDIKSDFFNENYEKVLDYNKRKIKNIYQDSEIPDSKIKSDLERRYLQARIRFYGIDSKYNKIKWSNLDTLVLLFTIIIFMLFIFLNR